MQSEAAATSEPPKPVVAATSTAPNSKPQTNGQRRIAGAKVARAAGPASKRLPSAPAPAKPPLAEVVPRPSVHETAAAQQRQPAGPNAISSVLLRASREHVARRVIAVWGSVSDETAMRAADVDLIARGLDLAGFSLREAIIRHRARQPRKYARAGKPRTAAAHRRVFTTRNVTTFLQAYAESLPTGAGLEDAPHWLPGDIALVKPSPRRAKLMVAVVSDRTNDEGVSLLITLDPKDKRARELHTLADYPVRGHFRLDVKRLQTAARKLGMRTKLQPVTL